MKSFQGLTLWQHPSFFAYFPTACTFEGMLGDLYASSTANPGFNVRCNRFLKIEYRYLLKSYELIIQWACSPACTELEAIVTDWSAKLLGLDKSFYNESEIGGGVIQVHYFPLIRNTLVLTS